MKAMSASQGTLVRVSGSSVSKAGGHQRQRRVLGAADGDFALQAGAAPDANTIHDPSNPADETAVLARAIG